MGALHQFLVQYIPVLNNSLFEIKEENPFVVNVLNKTFDVLDAEYASSTMNSHPFISLLLFLLFVLILGEILFFRAIKKNKAPYHMKDDIDKYIKNQKIKCFFFSFVFTLIGPYFLFFVLFLGVILLLMLYLLVINFIPMLFLLLEYVLVIGLGYFLLKYFFALLYYINKKIVKDKVQIETQEEYKESQKKFKIKDGEEVKIKYDLEIGKYYGGRRFAKSKANNIGKILIVDYHISNHDDQMRCRDKENGKRCVGIYTDEMLESIQPEVIK